jgi:chitodextrinase
LNDNLIEDMTAGNPGTYAATGSATKGWTMQMVALRRASSVTTPPSVPTNVTATPVSSSQINLSWTASTDSVGVTGYKVFRNGVQAGTTTAISYADMNLAPATTYSYTVAAFDAAGNVSAQSTAASATTLQVDTVPPTAPTNLSGASPLPTEVDLSWSPSTDKSGVAGYRVFRNGSQVATTTGTSYIDSGLTSSTTYTYAITALDAAGNVSAPSSPLSITTAPALKPAAYPLKVSSNGRYLVDQTNAPFLIVGDAAYTLSVMLSNADVDTYLADRAARGYNAIWMVLVDKSDQNNAPDDFFGNVPFDGAWFTNEDAAYWAHQDYVIQQAAGYGIAVFLMPSFIGSSSENYDLTAMLNSTDAVVSAYGTFIGNRYKGYNNIVYVLGGDTDPTTTGLTSKISDLGSAIAAADPNHLITFEGCRFTCNSGSNKSSIQAFGGSPPSWIDLNWAYNGQPTVVAGCQATYSSSPFLPPLMGEDFYELDSRVTEFQVRQEGYWEVLSGCYLGRMFGNDSIWTFNAIPASGGTTYPAWQSQLSSVGSLGQQFLGQLMRSREHWLMAPDTTHSVLTAGFGSGATLSVAARSADGQTIIAYFSDGNATAKTINMSMITSASSTARAWWYNPQEGTATLIGTFPNSGSQSFAAPDSNDWVLVIDDASANLPAPGSSTISTNPGGLVTNLTCSPTTLTSGATSTCTVTLNQSAPSGGTEVVLTNTNATALSVPNSVAVPSGASKATFSATAAILTTTQSATVTAILGTSSFSVSLTLLSGDNVPPTVSIQSPVAGQTVSGTVTLSATASDSVGVAWVQLKVDGVNVGPQIATAPYNYSLNTTSLTNATHTLVATASDLSGNIGTSAAVSIAVNNVTKPISFFQVAANSAPGSASTLSLSFLKNTVAGDLILVAFDFATSATPSSVTDSQGNVFTEVGAQLTSPSGVLSRVYYAKNIKGGADTVTVNLTANSGWIELYLTEYSGVDPTNPIDGQAGASGNAGAVSSGKVTTTVAGDEIYGYCVGDSACTAGSGFTARSTLNDNLIEDMTAGNPGTYAATGSATKGWTMQVVALKNAQ